MGNGRYPGSLCAKQSKLPLSTPGPLGHSDAADPDHWFTDFFKFWNSRPVFSPGPLGHNDAASAATQRPATEAEGTATLPEPNPNAPVLKDEDFEKAAKDFGVEVNIIRAVAEVESKGHGFDSAGRPKILFEAHLFHRFTKGKYDKDHETISQPTWNAKCKQYYKLDQWKRLDEAMRLNRSAALKSASWGAFQVMGYNHNGFDTVEAFVNAMFVSEGEHLKSFLAYCKDNKLIEKMTKKDWAGFAQAYNGQEYRQNKYDEKMQNAYERLSKPSQHLPVLP